MSITQIIDFDSNNIDNNLTTIANKIRTVTKKEDLLNFPSDFNTEIEQLYSSIDFLDYSKPVGDIYYTGTKPAPRGLRYRSRINKYVATNATYINSNQFTNSSVTSIIGPKIALIYNYACSGCRYLTIVDLGGTPSSSQGFTGSNVFDGAGSLSILILRSNINWPLSNINVFNSTPFASGRAGGTLYVPRDLIDTYKAATNWSTILGYMKEDGITPQNQILPIEDSEYYIHYSDGTLLPDVHESSTGKLYRPIMEINVSKDLFCTIPQVLNTYGNMEDLEELTLTGTVKAHTTGALLGIEKTFSNTKFPKLKKLYVQPTIFKNETGTITKESETCGHYVFSETNLTELVIGRQGGPYFSGGGYFRKDLPCPPGTDSYQVGSLDGLTIIVYTDQYSASAGFMLSPAPNTTVICKDYLTGEILTPPTE